MKRNHNDTVHAFTDETGAIVESYSYDAWGNVLAVYDSAGIEIPNQKSQISNRFLFQCREYSWATRLYNFRARWYDPATGQWLSNDPIGISGGLNQYVFCGNDPVNYVDPEGFESYYLTAGGGHASVVVPDATSISGYTEYSFAPVTGGRGTGLPLPERLDEMAEAFHNAAVMYKREAWPASDWVPINTTSEEE